MTIRVVGIDIGGANLKAATWNPDGQTQCVWQSFPLWKQPDQLGVAVKQLIDSLLEPVEGQPNGVPWLAITMTGELADCYATRREGVQRILQQITSVHPDSRTKVYAVGGRWLSPQQAHSDPWHVAASNWHALTNWLLRWPACCSRDSALWERAVVIDIGSTTVDILPIVNGQMISTARTDRDRLELMQLVYTGMERSPVCAIKSSFTLQGKTIPVMSELFATSDDAYLSLGLVEEHPDQRDTADGRPRTAAYARARLARMIGEDTESLDEQSIHQIAQQTIEAQCELIANAVEHNWKLACRSDATATSPLRIVATGHGKPLLQQVCERLSQRREVELHCLADRELTRAASRCAPAAAVAWLLTHDKNVLTSS